MQATCQWNECGVELEKPALGRPSRWCSEHKQRKYRSPDSATALCKEIGCIRPVRAKGMCSMHYRRGRPVVMLTIPCDACGNPCQKERSRLNKYATLYCTPKCKTEHQWRELWKTTKAVVRYDPAIAKVNKNRPKSKTATTAPRTFRCGNCAVCGQGFVTIRHQDVTCSDEACAKTYRMDKGQRRRARQRNAYRAPVSRAAIYIRDGHACQICGDPMDMEARAPHPLSPSIDHVIPLARGGTHEPSNVQAAHFLCNSRKSDRMDTLTLAA